MGIEQVSTITLTCDYPSCDDPPRKDTYKTIGDALADKWQIHVGWDCVCPMCCALFNF